MSQKCKAELTEFLLLLRSVPGLTLTLFVLSVFSMNLLANKSISLPFPRLALDCGILVSWFAFLTMDTITHYFGPKAASEISVLTILINLVFCLLFFAGSRIPGVWSAAGQEAVLNHALDRTFGGTWYVLLGSALSFLLSAFINNFLNFALGKAFHKNPNGFFAYTFRSYVSTAVGQFADNLTFALVVSHVFFGWSYSQCITCALTGMLLETLCEVLFSFFGFRVFKRWQRDNIGSQYFAYRKAQKECLH